MLNTADCVALARRYDGVKALTVYLSVPPDTGSGVAASHALLRRGIADLRASLRGASHTERETFDKTAALLSARAAEAIHAQGGGTWFAYATENGDLYDEALDVTMPTQVAWEDRVRIVPYLAWGDVRPALVLLADQERAVLYRLTGDQLTELDRIVTEPEIDQTGPYMSAPSRRGFHTGERGEPGADAAQRVAENAFRRHRTRIVTRLQGEDVRDAWIVAAGPPESVAQVLAALPAEIRARTRVAPSITLASSPAIIRAAAERARAEMRAAADRTLVESVLARARRPELSAIGLEPVDHALTLRAVGNLIIADSWVGTNGFDAEALVRRALAQDAAVDVVSGAAAETLASQAGGIAARLRFAVPVPVQ
jgi:hypothetical protein